MVVIPGNRQLCAPYNRRLLTNTRPPVSDAALPNGRIAEARRCGQRSPARSPKQPPTSVGLTTPIGQREPRNRVGLRDPRDSKGRCRPPFASSRAYRHLRVWLRGRRRRRGEHRPQNTSRFVRAGAGQRRPQPGSGDSQISRAGVCTPGGKDLSCAASATRRPAAFASSRLAPRPRDARVPRKGRGVAGAGGIPAAIGEQVLAALSALLVYAFM